MVERWVVDVWVKVIISIRFANASFLLGVFKTVGKMVTEEAIVSISVLCA